MSNLKTKFALVFSFFLFLFIFSGRYFVISAAPNDDCPGATFLGNGTSQQCWSKVRVDKYSCSLNSSNVCVKAIFDQNYCSSCGFNSPNSCDSNDGGVCSSSASCDTNSNNTNIDIGSNCSQCLSASDRTNCNSCFNGNFSACTSISPRYYRCLTSYSCSCVSYPTCWYGSSGTPPPPPPPPTNPPGCGTCGGCTPACDSSCTGTCSGNGASCTINGSPCSTPTPTPNPGNAIGYHDVFGYSATDTRTTIENQVDQTVANCRAAGWATDPDDRSLDLFVRVLSDGVQVGPAVIASNFRGDLDADCSDGVCANVCPGGTCSYDIDLKNLITRGVDHVVRVQAQDAQVANAWSDLSNTPRTLNCACSSITTAPTIIAPSPVNKMWVCGTNSITFDWNDVPGASYYSIRIDEHNTPTDASWDDDCSPINPGDSCEDLPLGQTFYTRSVTPGKYYTYWIHGRNACGDWGPIGQQYTTGIPVSSINVSSNPTQMQNGTKKPFSAAVYPVGAIISNVNFTETSTPPGVVNITGTNPVNFPGAYTTEVTAARVGTAYIGANANLGAQILCSDTSASRVDVVANAPGWWQVRGGDVTSGGDIVSSIPTSCSGTCVSQFNLANAGLYPGVNAYFGTASFGTNGTAGPSGKSWLVNSDSTLTKKFDYAYFNSQLPADVVAAMTEVPIAPAIDYFNSGGTQVRGYYWYHFDGASKGNLTLRANTIDGGVPGRKVVLLVDGANLIINSKVRLTTDGSDFFMAVVGKTTSGTKGDITISPAVTSANATDYAIEGLYVAEGTISTGTTGTGDTRLVGKGSFVAYGGFNLQRDLADNRTTPAELFEYGPEMVMNLPPVFTYKKVQWQEVAP